MAIVCLLYKNKGEVRESNNYRGVLFTTSSGKNFFQCFGHWTVISCE
jgi:hypothetical protein